MAELVKVDIATCYHCGEPCKEGEVYLQEKIFCCEGCKVVYEILQDNGLCTYYDLEKNPGISLKGKNFGDKYAYLVFVRKLKKLVSL
ncbi:hypothetical protein BH23BAC1_BH23BAC1_39480 [soil metagenome]